MNSIPAFRSISTHMLRVRRHAVNAGYRYRARGLPMKNLLRHSLTLILPLSMTTGCIVQEEGGGETAPASPTTPTPPPAPPPPPPPPVSRLSGWLTDVSVDGVSGRWRTDTFPRDSGGPRIRVVGNTSIVNGGTTELRVEGTSRLRFLLIGEQEEESGYYEVPARGDRVTVRLVFAQDIPSDLRLQLAAASDGGATGPPVRKDFDVVEVGTGELQITLSWDEESDVDLHVVEPSGEEIYYGNRVSASGGALDLDSNASCRIDGVKNENVTWERSAPSGRYTVRVNYWSACGVDRTRYLLRITGGGDSRILSGTLTGSGERGGLGAGEEVVSFEWR